MRCGHGGRVQAPGLWQAGESQAHSKDSKTLSWMAGFLRGCLLTQLGQKAPSTLFPAHTARCPSTPLTLG